MPIDTADIFGSDQVGIHIAVVGGVFFHPSELPAKEVDLIQSILQLEPAPQSVGGSYLLGALIAGNSKALVVADIATEHDIDQLTSFGDVVVMEGGVNTAGNLLLINEQGIIASPSIPDDGLELLADVFSIPVVASSIADHDVVGSVAIANDKGILVHPDINQDEAIVLEEILGVAPMVGTVSFGSPFVGSGVVASNTGAIAGTSTTGPELNRIEDALGLLD